MSIFSRGLYTPEPTTHIPPPMPIVKPEIRIAYLCDRKACGDLCSYPECKHTSDVTHANNFQKFGCINALIEKESD